MVNGVNTLTQNMINDENTIYVIQYDFVLCENITIPTNCILDFDGGSISGAYTITGNNTGIEAGLIKIFNTDITFSGTWATKYINIKNFGAVGDGVIDDTNAFVSALNFVDIANNLENGSISPGQQMKGSRVFIPNGRYKISNTLHIKSQTIFEGETTNGVIINSSANIGIQIDGTLYNGSYIGDNIILRNFYLLMDNNSKIGIKNNANTPISNSLFENFYIQGAEVGIIFKALWNNRFSNINILLANVGIILSNDTNMGNNNNIFENVKCVSCNKCGVYLKSANGLTSNNLNIEGIGNNWRGDYDSVKITVIDNITYNPTYPCAVYIEGLAYANHFNNSWFEALHEEENTVCAFYIANADQYEGTQRMSVNIENGYFNNDVDIPIRLSTNGRFFISKLQYWSNLNNGSIVVDFVDGMYLDLSLVDYSFVENIKGNPEKAVKWANIHDILGPYNNFIKNYTFQNLQGYVLDKNYYSNPSNPVYSVSYEKQIDTGGKKIQECINSVPIIGYDYNQNRLINFKSGGDVNYSTTNNGVLTIPGSWVYGAKYDIHLTALDSVGAAAIAGGYYISRGDYDNLQITFAAPPSTDCLFNYTVINNFSY